MKRSGPRIDPCGTPQITFSYDDFVLLFSIGQVTGKPVI